MQILVNIWKFLLNIPMPWRAELIIWSVAIMGNRLVYHLLRLLLLPEFLITNRLRRWNLKPLPGTYAFGSLIEWSIRILRISTVIVIFTAILGVIGWYIYPYVKEDNEKLASYIKHFINWWYLLEKNVVGKT
jgi:hypothetical protein